MAYHADTLAIVVPYAAFVVTLGCATVLTSVPPAPAALFSVTRDTSRVRTARHGRSSSPALASYTWPPPSPGLTARRAWLGASQT
jgi:hypothetical protein